MRELECDDRLGYRAEHSDGQAAGQKRGEAPTQLCLEPRPTEDRGSKATSHLIGVVEQRSSSLGAVRSPHFAGTAAVHPQTQGIHRARRWSSGLCTTSFEAARRRVDAASICRPSRGVGLDRRLLVRSGIDDAAHGPSHLIDGCSKLPRESRVVTRRSGRHWS